MTIFKCIVTLKSGAKKIVRMNSDIVDYIRAQYEQFKKSIWREIVFLKIFDDCIIVLNDVLKFVFVNEYTHEKTELA